MIDTLLRCAEVRDYLSYFPRKDWSSCIEATLRLGIRRVRAAAPSTFSLQSVLSVLRAESSSEGVSSLKEKMSSLKQELEVMSKDLKGFESREGRKTTRPKGKTAAKRPTLGKSSGRVKTEGSEDLARSDTAYSSYQQSPPLTSPQHHTTPYYSTLPLQSDSADPFRAVYSPHHIPLRPPTAVDLDRALQEPRTNKEMLARVATVRTEPSEDYFEYDEDQLKTQSAVMAIADEFLANPFVSGLASYRSD